MASNNSLQIIGSPSSPLKWQRLSSGSSVRLNEVLVLLPQLLPGVDATTKVFVCRKWDASNAAGKYISAEFIMSDFMGNAIHCVARSNIAHCFAGKLIVGKFYLMKCFTVMPNKQTYRIRDSDPYIIQLEGNSVVRQIDCPTTGFTQYPVQLHDIDSIVVNDNRFLIDVVGSVVNMGQVRPTRNGSQFLDFELLNERGRAIKVTFWSALCDDLLKRVGDVPPLYIVLLPSMNVKEYRGEVFLSSTSATCIYDSNEIEDIAQLRHLIDKFVGPDQTRTGLFTNSCDWEGTQEASHSVTMYCPLMVTGIRASNSWHYFSCGFGNCKKGLSHVENSFWCKSRERVCEFPVPRFRLEMELFDPTASTVVIVFDEIVESMVMKTAATLLQTHEDNEVPREVLQLVGTTYVLELKTHTYYDHGFYESFTASRLIRKDLATNVPPQAPDVADDHLPKVLAVDDIPQNEDTTTSNGGGIKGEGSAQAGIDSA